MDLEFVEPHPQRVLEAFRQGCFDELEIIGQGDEKDFFELCFLKRILPTLAESMPTARKKEEVPRWFILAANLSLKLHGQNAYSGFEEVVRCGGLLQALDPAIAAKYLDPETQRCLVHCQGFNDKNTYERTTPCDQDFLRKVARDVAAEDWLGWFNGAVQETFQSYGFFDPEGIFIGDGSYLFVPDNPAYEGSVVMWFDQHNHPVDYEKLDPEARRKVVRRRCYKWVSLLHCRGESFVYAAAALVPGNTHENAVLWRLVDQFVQRVGRGVLKWLILDRGFIDGAAISRCKTEHGVDVIIPIKKNMDLWADAWALVDQGKWEPLPEPGKGPASPAPQRPEAIVQREAKRQKTLMERRAQEPAPPLKPRQEACAIEGFTSWSAASVPLEVVLIRAQGPDEPDSRWALLTTASAIKPARLVQSYKLRTGIEERHRQVKCFYDLTDFRSRSFNAIAAQLVFILLAYTLRQWQLWTLQKTVWAGLSPEQLQQRLAIHTQWVVIYHQMAYVQLPLTTFTREVLELEGEARLKALAKVRDLEQRLLAPMAPLRPRPP